MMEHVELGEMGTFSNGRQDFVVENKTELSLNNEQWGHGHLNTGYGCRPWFRKEPGR